MSGDHTGPDVRIVREHDAATARAGRDVSLRDLNHALAYFGITARPGGGHDLQIVQTRDAVTPLRARVAALVELVEEIIGELEALDYVHAASRFRARLAELRKDGAA